MAMTPTNIFDQTNLLHQQYKYNKIILISEKLIIKNT
jgi:hypothetical protein